MEVQVVHPSVEEIERLWTQVLGTVFARADRLLYAAKHAGRNQLRTGTP